LGAVADFLNLDDVLMRREELLGFRNSNKVSAAQKA